MKLIALLMNRLIVDHHLLSQSSDVMRASTDVEIVLSPVVVHVLSRTTLAVLGVLAAISNMIKAYK